MSLRYLNPQQYYRIVHLMNSKRDEREEYINTTIENIKEATKDLDIEAVIYGRPKHIYSIYRKMKDQRNSLEIYDLLAIRVLVDSIKIATPFLERFIQIEVSRFKRLYRGFQRRICISPSIQP